MILCNKHIWGQSLSCDPMVVGFTTTCAISVYPQWSCKFKPFSWWGVLNTTWCVKVCQGLVTCRWFPPGTPVSSTNKTDCHDITEILLKVALNTINQPNPNFMILSYAINTCFIMVIPNVNELINFWYKLGLVWLGALNRWPS